MRLSRTTSSALRMLSDMADEYGCSHFILISTDKAVNPTNVMGATEAHVRDDHPEEGRALPIPFSRQCVSAMCWGAMAASSLSSSGSSKEGGPLTVTHKDIVRYFMTIPEASRLVITAGALAKGGEIFVLDMGEPVQHLRLGREPHPSFRPYGGADIEIKVTGLRPGEKLYEELNMSDEPTKPTANGSITVICGVRPEVQTVQERMDLLAESLELDVPELKLKLAEAVPTYHPEIKG